MIYKTDKKGHIYVVQDYLNSYSCSLFCRRFGEERSKLTLLNKIITIYKINFTFQHQIPYVHIFLAQLHGNVRPTVLSPILLLAGICNLKKRERET